MFVNLKIHTTFSLAEGAIKIKELLSFAKDNGEEALGICDTGNLFGALQFSKACKDAGIQPIIGSKIALQATQELDPRVGQREIAENKIPINHVSLYAKNREGYVNLMKLSSIYYENGRNIGECFVTYDDLAKHSKGLILLSGGRCSPINEVILAHKDPTPIVDYFNNNFKDSFYIELSRQGFEEEKATEDQLIKIALEKEIPLVATNETFYIGKDKQEAHDALLCIADGEYVSSQKRRKSSTHFRFKTSAEMKKIFADIPEAIYNTENIAKRCAFMVEPAKPMLPPFDTALGEKAELEKQAREGLRKLLDERVLPLLGDDKDKIKETEQLYQERLDYELSIINNMGFDGYFLIVSDFIKWAKSQDIPVGPGRGSGAGSIVAWALSITNLDPIRFGLLFERFLNPERVSMPDFDVDFCQTRRDEVISYVQNKYGKDKVAQIITFGKLQAKAVVRDVGRVLQVPYFQVDKLSKLIPNNPANPPSLDEALEMEPDFAKAYKTDPNAKSIIDIGKKLEGLYRHASTHAAGVVIGGKPLTEIVGLYYDPRGDMPATQFNMKDVEAVGLVKFDFLGLKTLSIIHQACKFAKNRGIDIDIDKIPLDDKKTFELLHHKDTVGVFQLESTGMRDVIGKMQPDKFEDIIALVALYRPGPMDNIPTYIARKHGKEKVEYPHPTLEKVLSETYGIAVYQEQVMQIAQIFAGYTLGGADLLRRAMGKKIKEEMDKQRAVFIEGAVKTHKDVTEKLAGEIFDQVEKFAGYGFNKSHAAAYALVAYQTAYLKANFPVEFMAASMNYDLNNTDKLTIFKQDLDHLGIKILPPDVNKSDAYFSVEKDSSDENNNNNEADNLCVRYGLAAIKNVGEHAMEELVRERNKNGPYKSIIDLAQRLDSKSLNKRQLENLIQAGAFDSLHSNRKQLFDSIEIILSQVGLIKQEKESRQASLFGDDLTITMPEVKLKDTSSWGKSEELSRELSAIGFYLTAHPISAYREEVKELRHIEIKDIAKNVLENGIENFNVAATILGKQVRISKNSGNKFAFLQFSDPTGATECIVFGDSLGTFEKLLEEGKNVYLTLNAKIDESKENFSLSLRNIEDLDEKISSSIGDITVKIENETKLKQLKEVLQNNIAKSPAAGVKIFIETKAKAINSNDSTANQQGNTHNVKIRLGGKYKITKDLKEIIENL